MNKNDMTCISKSLFEKATSPTLTIKDAVCLLNEQAQIRTLREKIEKFYTGDNLKRDIVEGLMRNNPSAKRDSIERKVRGWMNDSERNISKHDAIEVAFVLKLEFEKADEFIALVSEERLHLRNPEEVVFMYAFNSNMSYNEAIEIYNQIKDIFENKVNAEESDKSFTAFVGNKLREITNEQQLVEFMKDNRERLGVYHNTAYKYFMEYMNFLIKPGSDVFDDMPSDYNMTIRKIVDTYFDHEIIPRFQKNSADNKRAYLSSIQKNILQNWPDEFSLSKIKNREADVTRKALILAFLITNGGDSRYGEYDEEGGIDFTDEYFDDLEMTQEELFSEMYGRMNFMLTDCGFSKLDPRVPFDWMIIYSMFVSDTFDIDEKKHGFLENMFSN